MKLGNIGEFGLIERFAPLFMKNIPEGTLGIGDDCAVIPLNSDKSGSDNGDGGLNFKNGKHKSGDCLLVTTDLLLENVHFLKNRITAEELGYKSLAVNLSDIAAMGGTPLFCFLSLGLPADTDIDWADDFFKGFNSLAEESSTLLMGGDTTSSKEGIVINVAVIGKSDLSHVKYRSGAKPEDYICITGMTGDSAAGLHVVLNNSPETSLTNNLLHSHNCPRPHIEEGSFLSCEDGVHSMMDISDGIDSDLRHIMKKSAVSAQIDLGALPLSENLKAAEKELGIDPYQCALGGGEDYCLLLTVDPEKFSDISRRFENNFSRPLYKIGKVTSLKKDGELSSEIDYLQNCNLTNIDGKGFDHFKR